MWTSVVKQNAAVCPSDRERGRSRGYQRRFDFLAKIELYLAGVIGGTTADEPPTVPTFFRLTKK